MPNDRLLEISEPGISMIEAFAAADQVLLAGVQGITDLITTPGLINLDFADVKSVMQGAGAALMGIGSARGADRAIKAAELAVASPLLEASVEGAHGVLLSIQGSSNLALSEIYEASSLVQDVVHPEANIIFGTVIDDTLGDEVRVTVIAAGFDTEPSSSTVKPDTERGRRGSHVETLEEASGQGRPSAVEGAAAGAAATGAGAAAASTAAESESFSEEISHPPVESQISDPAFDGDDLDLDIPEFLR